MDALPQDAQTNSDGHDQWTSQSVASCLDGKRYCLATNKLCRHSIAVRDVSRATVCREFCTGRVYSRRPCSHLHNWRIGSLAKGDSSKNMSRSQYAHPFTQSFSSDGDINNKFTLRFLRFGY